MLKFIEDKSWVAVPITLALLQTGMIACGKKDDSPPPPAPVAAPQPLVTPNTVNGYTPLPGQNGYGYQNNGYQIWWDGYYGYQYSYLIQQCYATGNCSNYLWVDCRTGTCVVRDMNGMVVSNYNFGMVDTRFYLNYYTPTVMPDCYFRVRPFTYEGNYWNYGGNNWNYYGNGWFYAYIHL